MEYCQYNPLKISRVQTSLAVDSVLNDPVEAGEPHVSQHVRFRPNLGVRFKKTVLVCGDYKMIRTNFVGRLSTEWNNEAGSTLPSVPRRNYNTMPYFFHFRPNEAFAFKIAHQDLRPFRDKSNGHLSDTPVPYGRPQGDIHAIEMTRVYNGDARKTRDKEGNSGNERVPQCPRSHQEWEQGRRRPKSAVRACLTVIDRTPQAVEKALMNKS